MRNGKFRLPKVSGRRKIIASEPLVDRIGADYLPVSESLAFCFQIKYRLVLNPINRKLS